MTFAQIATELDELKPWFQYGLAGVIIWYLMHRVDGRLGRIEHVLTGLNRTLLIDLITRDGLSEQAKGMARTELARNEARGGKKGSADPFSG